MKNFLSISKYFTIAFIFMIVGTLKAQSILSQDFESFTLGDSTSIGHVSYSPNDIKTKIVTDPLGSTSKVLKVTTTSYGAAPVLKFVLPAGKTLADYDSLTFMAYYQSGDLTYKLIVASAYQTNPTGHHFLDADTNYSYNRTQGASTSWERISLAAKKVSNFSDTVYIAIGTNNSGATWYIDSVNLVAKQTTGPIYGTGQDFESFILGDSTSIGHVSYSPNDIKTKIVTDSVGSMSKVLKVTTTNYGAAPVLKFVLPAGKTLADYDSLTFMAYYQSGDLTYKLIVASAYQTNPTGHHFLDADTNYSYNRTQGASTSWERISLAAKKVSNFSDTVYIAIGTNNSGATWYLDDVNLVAKKVTPPPPDTGNIVTNGGFEDSNTGVVDTTDVKGWEIQVAAGVTPLPEFRIVSDTVEEGSRALKVTVHGLGVNQWDIQIIADSLHITPGALYDYSIWAKSEKAGATVNFTTWSQAGGEYNAIRPATLSTQWKKFTMQFTVSDTTRIIRAPIHFYGTPDTGNSIYIDNLVIARHIEVVDSSLIWKGPALAAGASKFLGSAGDAPAANFADYWTQLTPENAGKWGSVGTSADTTQWNWSGLDNDYNYAKNHGLIFKDHNLIWGQQQPSWISSLDSATQYNYIKTWIRMVGQRYPDIDMIDVVNEPLNGHNPPDGLNNRANYENALGGKGKTGWDWVVNAFKLARKYLPKAKLLINDYGILNSSSNTDAYISVINILKDSSLIDGIGCQAHGLENTSAATVKSNLDKLAATGIPIYISEFDLNIANDNQQMTKYQELFPVFWQHPDVKGVTLWGYIQGRTWLTSSFLVHTNGTARPALFWLAQYIKNPTDVKETASNLLPSKYELDQNYPNPFNPSTNIRYSIVNAAKVTLKVYDILGREVQTLVNKEQAPGHYVVKFNAENLASGVYLYRITAGDFTATKKLMLLK
jgi:GH35 family endo-1,4-beta-xylanase